MIEEAWGNLAGGQSDGAPFKDRRDNGIALRWSVVAWSRYLALQLAKYRTVCCLGKPWRSWQPYWQQ